MAVSKKIWTAQMSTAVRNILLLSTPKLALSVNIAPAHIKFTTNFICSKSTTSTSKTQLRLPSFMLYYQVFYSANGWHFDDRWTKIHFPLNSFLLCSINLPVRFPYMLLPGTIFFCRPFNTFKYNLQPCKVLLQCRTEIAM